MENQEAILHIALNVSLRAQIPTISQSRDIACPRKIENNLLLISS